MVGSNPRVPRAADDAISSVRCLAFPPSFDTPRLWRRGRDSNPRSPLGLTGFRDRPDQPLQHLSKSGDILADSREGLAPGGPGAAYCRESALGGRRRTLEALSGLPVFETGLYSPLRRDVRLAPKLGGGPFVPRTPWHSSTSPNITRHWLEKRGFLAFQDVSPAMGACPRSRRAWKKSRIRSAASPARTPPATSQR